MRFRCVCQSIRRQFEIRDVMHWWEMEFAPINNIHMDTIRKCASNVCGLESKFKFWLHNLIFVSNPNVQTLSAHKCSDTSPWTVIIFR
jgi:hypothetical protein